MSKLKESGIEWIGRIPEGWNICKVKDIFFRKNEKANIENPTVLSLARTGVKIRDISNGEGQLAENYSKYNPVEIRDLLLNPMDLYSGANCSISEVEGVISPAYFNLRTKRDDCAKYYDYYFKTQYWGMVLFAHGKGVSFDNRWTLNSETLMNYYLPHPSSEEQKRIVIFLDKKIGEIDNAIKKTKETIEDYKKLIVDLINETIKNGFNVRNTKDSNLNHIGFINEDWEIVKFKYILDCKIDNRGRTPETSNNNKDIPLIEVNAIGEKYPNLNQVKKYITKESHDKYIRKDLLEGDIIITTVGATIGKCSIVPKNVNYCIAQNLVGYRVNKDQFPLFWFYYFKSRLFQDMFSQYDKGNTINNVKISDMEQAKVVVPDYNSQIKIANYLDEKCNEIDKLIENKEKIIEELEQYKKSVIYEYVTGKKEVK